MSNVLTNTIDTSIGNLVYTTCLNAKPDEAILIIADSAKKDIASMFNASAKTISKNVRMIVFDDMTESGQEPPQNIVNALYSCNIALIITTYSLSHTKTRLEASRRGARIISMPGITTEMLNRSVDVDYVDQTKRTEIITDILTNGSKAMITAPGGTDVRFSIDGRTALADGGFCTQKGDFINLPAGEAFVAPMETTAEGIIVFDGAIASIPLDAPITVTVKQGTIQSLAGGTAAAAFEQRLIAAGPFARVICEFGIGTNKNAPVSPEILEAEKAYGTCHIAFGRNITFGGINDVPFHTDGLIREPTITIDKIMIMKKGKFLI